MQIHSTLPADLFQIRNSRNAIREIFEIREARIQSKLTRGRDSSRYERSKCKSGKDIYSARRRIFTVRKTASAKWKVLSCSNSVKHKFLITLLQRGERRRLLDYSLVDSMILKCLRPRREQRKPPRRRARIRQVKRN